MISKILNYLVKMLAKLALYLLQRELRALLPLLWLGCLIIFTMFLKLC